MGNVSFAPRTRTRSWAAAFTGKNLEHKTSSLGTVLRGIRTCISGYKKAWTVPRERGSRLLSQLDKVGHTPGQQEQ